MSEYLPLIVEDPGHGGLDPGAAAGGLVEKFITWRWALALQTVLLDCFKCRVLVVQPSAEFVSTGRDELIIPPARSNALEADYFISLHVNAGGGTGYESYCKRADRGTEADRIRGVIHRYMLEELKPFGMVPHDRPGGDGVKFEDFYVLKNTNAWSSLHELLFIDGVTDRGILSDPLFVWRAAVAMAGGIGEGLKLERKVA